MGRKPKPENCCADCGEYIFKFVDIIPQIINGKLVDFLAKNYFMVKKNLWEKFGNGDKMLCINCFEKRMGRSLEIEDFLYCEATLGNLKFCKLKFGVIEE